MQIWPMFENDRRAAAAAAASTSPSSSTTNGVWPPSSSETRFIPSAAPRMIACPVRVEAVALMSRIAGWRTSASPSPGPGPGRSLSTPGGSPAPVRSSATRPTASGVCSGGLTMTGQPAASAGATFQQ